MYDGQNYLVLDFETYVNDGAYGSAIGPRNALALAVWYTPATGYHSCWADEYSQGRLLDAVAKCDFLVAHQAKYELGWLDRCGYDISKLLVFDTKIGEYVLAGNLCAGDPDSGVKRLSTSLNDCCVRRDLVPKDPIVDIWMRNGINVRDMPMRWIEDRCKLDVASTHELFRDQRRQLIDSNRLAVLYTRCLLTPILALIEKEGMHLDKDRVQSTFNEYNERLIGLERSFSEVTGGINWRSSKQVASYLYDTLGFEEPSRRDGTPKRSAGGKRLANAKVLSKLTARTEPQKEFLKLKADIGKVGSALSKNLSYFKEVCDTRDGIFNAEFNQTVTATHRLSSNGIRSASGSSVQFQNLPRAFKCLFSARRNGWLIGEADGAQLEYRTAAYLGNDTQARADISDPTWDIHSYSGSVMAKKPYEEVRDAVAKGEKWAKDIRQGAKEETFGPLFGKQEGTAAQKRWYKEFRDRYHELEQVQKGWVYEVLAKKRLITPWGLRYYFPHVRMSDSGYCNVGNAIYNYPIQALATAEIIPIAIVHFYRRLREENLVDYIIPVNTVHDSLVCEIHPDYVDDFKRIARLAFGEDVHKYLLDVYKMDFDVPLGCGIKVGPYWGQGEEVKYEYLRAA